MLYERPPIALQKAVNYTLKGRLSQGKRRPFVVHPQFRCMEYKANKHIHPTVIQAEGNMFRRICNPPKFTIRICNPLKPHIYIMMYVGERIANPHLETAGLQIRRNKYAYT